MFAPHTRPNADGSRNDESAWDSLFGGGSTAAPPQAPAWTPERRAEIQRLAAAIGGTIYDHGAVIEIADGYGNTVARVKSVGTLPTPEDFFGGEE